MRLMRSALLAFGMLVFTLPALASEPELIGTFDDWAAYHFQESEHDVCYMVSKPQKAEGKYTTRGEPYAMITHRPAEKTKDVFSYIAGYPYKEGGTVTLDISGKKFTLYTQGETAWANDASTDSQIAAALKKGSGMIVKGVSLRGTETTDTYGLKGSTDAYKAISEKCGI